MRKPNASEVRKEMNVSDIVLQRCVAEYSTGRFRLKLGEIITYWQKSHGIIVITHRPTGVQVASHFCPSSHSKRIISQMRQDLVKLHLPNLGKNVRLHLRACMARQFGPIPNNEKYTE